MNPSIRKMMAILALAGFVSGLACTAAQVPTPTAIPAKGTPASANPPTSASPSAQAPAKTAEKPQAAADWKVDWDNTVAAAKKEGKVTVAGNPGEPYHNAALPFQKAFPDIQLDYVAVDGPALPPKIFAERDAGQYLWDVHLGGSTTPITMLVPKGIFDPIPPTLVLPEVLDDNKWVGGLAEGWLDKEQRYVMGFEGKVFYVGYVNRDLMPESELSTFDQLLEPKWKGRIGIGDPRTAGSSNGAVQNLLQAKGEDWVRRFLAQDLILIKDERMLVEGLFRGRYPVIVGVNAASVEMFKKEGLGKNVQPLEPDDSTGANLSTSRGNIMLVNKAPHPSAAKVFINWVLSREGQKAYVEGTEANSRRLDVEGPADYAPRPGVKYITLNKEDFVPYKTRAMEIAKDVIK